MQTIERRWPNGVAPRDLGTNKAEYPPGPWHDEPDKVQWPDESTGLPCLAVRGPVGAWCGYVGVDPVHPLHGQSGEELDVHGGVTFADECVEDEKELGICHVPDPGEPDDVWWFGFDCAHAFDYMPGLRIRTDRPPGKSLPGDVYRDLAYVRSECAQLASQLASHS